MFYTGIDQHKRDSYLTTYGPDGTIVNQARFPNTRLRFERYFASFQGPHQAVVESTGSWYWLADLLADLGVTFRLAHATRLRSGHAEQAHPPNCIRSGRHTRLIGKPGVVPGTYLGPPQCEATARVQPRRAGEPIMVCGRHAVWRIT